MQSVVFGAVLALAAGIAVVYATVGGGQYSVNVHFVPPLVAGPCNIAQFWVPPNVTCAMCFCMTGTLSRCVPQPGCSPMNATTTTPSPSTSTQTSTSSSSAAQNQNPTTQQQQITPEPTSAPASAAPAEGTSMPSFAANLV